MFKKNIHKSKSVLSSLPLLSIVLCYFLTFGNTLATNNLTEDNHNSYLQKELKVQDISFFHQVVQNEVLDDLLLLNESENNEQNDFNSNLGSFSSSFFNVENSIEWFYPNFVDSTPHFTKKYPRLFILFHCWKLDFLS